MFGYLSNESIKSSDNFHNLALYLWEPADRPRGIVQIVHGMREHMNRYEDFANYLNRHGYIVCGHDQLGHGRTAKENDDYGFFAEKNGSRFLVNDCHLVSKWVTERCPDLPLFLFGHSMGSFIGRIYIVKYAGLINGFICMATSGDRTHTPFARAVNEIAGKIRGANKANMFSDMAFNISMNRKIHEGDNAWISRDKNVQQEFAKNQYSRHRPTNSAYNDILDLQIASCSKEWIKKVPLELPIFILSGEEDPLGGYGKGPVQVYDRLKMAGVKDVKCKLYEGARHELLNEINREEVYYDILEWLDTRLPYQSSGTFYL